MLTPQERANWSGSAPIPGLTDASVIRVIQVIDFMSVESLSPVRVNWIHNWRVVDTGLSPAATRTAMLEAITKKVSDVPKTIQHLQYMRASVASLTIGMWNDSRKQQLNTDDRDMVEVPQLDISRMRISTMAWNNFCMYRGKHPRGSKDFTTSEAVITFWKFVNILERTKVHWMGINSNGNPSVPNRELGSLASKTNKCLLTGPDERHVIVTDGIDILDYTYIPDKKDAWREILKIKDRHAAGPYERHSFSRELLRARAEQSKPVLKESADVPV